MIVPIKPKFNKWTFILGISLAIFIPLFLFWDCWIDIEGCISK